ncbi:MAG: hypothetical protein IPH93_13950 [Saprospiraceae bacterium]|nr:hypothetical protein [Saprospiraceae bacterium]MBK9630564.1 hypothetical protein [Saprospiraceae bacterium]
MKISIKDSLTIEEIKDQFSKKFPYLKIEFFTKPHKKFTGSKKENMIPTDVTIGESRSVHSIGELIIDEHTKVAHLEKEMLEKFGLFAQVFRRSGKVWIETTVTDDWTLEKQNTEAESFIKDIRENEDAYNREHLS